MLNARAHKQTQTTYQTNKQLNTINKQTNKQTQTDPMIAALVND